MDNFPVCDLFSKQRNPTCQCFGISVFLWVVVTLTTELRFKRLISSCLLPLSQNESSCETNHMKMCSPYRFIFMQINLIFHFCTWTRFETEAQGNPKMVYCYFKPAIRCCLLFLAVRNLVLSFSSIIPREPWQPVIRTPSNEVKMICTCFTKDETN